MKLRKIVTYKITNGMHHCVTEEGPAMSIIFFHHTADQCCFLFNCHDIPHS